MNKKTFNPAEWLHTANEPAQAPTTPATKIEQEIDTVTRRIEESGKDITAGYDNWRDLAFALSDALGEEGRQYFHRVSRFNPDYNQVEADKQYTACLKSGGSGITVKTFFQKAKEHGISVAISSKTSKSSVSQASVSQHTPPISQAEETEDSEETEELPTFSDRLRFPLPDFLQKVVEAAEAPQERDMLTLGAVTVISALLPGVSGVYKRHRVYPNLYLFVTADASAGKGLLDYCRYLAEPIHDAIRESNRKDKEEYERRQAEYNAAKPKDRQTMDKPKEPPTRMLFIPADSSATAMCQALFENEERGLMFETEGDTLANTFASDYGNYSNDFRKAFHHEKISYYRRKDHELAEIKNPRLSTVLSGTPQQILNLITDAENGLFSRFIFYCLPTRLVWDDVFADDDLPTLDDYFMDLGKELQDFHATLLAAGPILFKITDEQKPRFNQWFESVQLRYSATYGKGMIPSIRRLGLVTFRIAMVFSLLRLMEDGDFSDTVICRDEDYENALLIAATVLEHIVSVFCTLPKSTTPSHVPGAIRTLTKQRFWDALPESFETRGFNALAASQNLPAKTAQKYIAEWCRGGQLLHVAQGKYSKSKHA